MSAALSKLPALHWLVGALCLATLGSVAACSTTTTLPADEPQQRARAAPSEPSTPPAGSAEPPTTTPPEPIDPQRQQRYQLLSQAQRLQQQQDYAGALELLDDYLAEHPEDTQALLRQGNALSLAGRPWEAVSAFETAFQLGDPTPQLPAALSELWRRLGKPELALRYAAHAAEVEPTPQARLRYAQLLAEQGQLDQARGQLTLLGDQLSEAQQEQALGQLLTAAGETDQGLLHLSRALELGLDAPELTEYVAAALFARGQYEQSAQLLRRSLRRSPKKALQRALILALVRSGRSHQAEQELQLYRQRYPGDPAADTMAQQIGEARR